MSAGKSHSMAGQLAGIPRERALGRQVLECASPLALWLGESGRLESARGLAHSKTLTRARGFMGSKRELSVEGSKALSNSTVCDSSFA